jgi:hypothetical protein
MTTFGKWMAVILIGYGVCTAIRKVVEWWYDD